jgi:uncharacterized coiled-coil protein SlyX
MSDTNLSEKISETISIAFKKTKVFEKMGRMQFLFGTFVIITSFIGITNMYMSYLNLTKMNEAFIKKSNSNESLHKLENKIEELEKIIGENIHVIEKTNDNIKNLECKIHNLEEKITIYQHSLNEIKDSVQIKIEKNTTMTSFSQTEDLEIKLGHSKCNEESKYNLEEDNELINECYDNIPLNNAKKMTGFNWFCK